MASFTLNPGYAVKYFDIKEDAEAYVKKWQERDPKYKVAIIKITK
ncbi:MAG: hypothetical protein P4N59_03540 [Negativicutes bacterium]|nr:hypothetical protein [Negativicutes bacterium]